MSDKIDGRVESDRKQATEQLRADRAALVGYARRLAPGEDAEDIAQEAFCRILVENRQFASGRGYLFQVARNLVIDLYRKKRTRENLYAQIKTWAEASAEQPDPAHSTELREDLRRVNDMLRRLPHRQRTVFVLQAVQGYTYEEIAAELGVSLAVVRKDLQKAFAACARHARARGQSEGVEKKTRRGSLRE